jgi:hypothetical protein
VEGGADIGLWGKGVNTTWLTIESGASREGERGVLGCGVGFTSISFAPISHSIWCASQCKGSNPRSMYIRLAVWMVPETAVRLHNLLRLLLPVCRGWLRQGTVIAARILQFGALLNLPAVLYLRNNSC